MTILVPVWHKLSARQTSRRTFQAPVLLRDGGGQSSYTDQRFVCQQNPLNLRKTCHRGHATPITIVVWGHVLALYSKGAVRFAELVFQLFIIAIVHDEQTGVVEI